MTLVNTVREFSHRVHMTSWHHGLRGISATQIRILEFLGTDDESRSVGAIAKDLAATPATASDSIAALRRRKLVTRTPHAEDGRITMIGLTNLGHSILTELKST